MSQSPIEKYVLDLEAEIRVLRAVAKDTDRPQQRRSQTMDKPTENQNFAAKFREAQKEIDRLTHELTRLRRLEAAVSNRAFVWQCPYSECEDTVLCQDAMLAALLAAMKEERP